MGLLQHDIFYIYCTALVFTLGEITLFFYSFLSFFEHTAGLSEFAGEL